MYVTHDQDEALTMSDRVAVFNMGVVEHVGTPEEIYDNSASEFVCNFIGDSSLLTPDFLARLSASSPAVLNPDRRSYLRVEKASLAPAGGGAVVRDGQVGLAGRITARSYHGAHNRYTVESHGASLGVLVREDGAARLEPGSAVTVYVDPTHVLQYAAPSMDGPRRLETTRA